MRTLLIDISGQTPTGYDVLDIVPTVGEPATDLRRLAIATVLTHARARVDDLPKGVQRRGYWADSLNKSTRTNTGSTLWLFRRSVVTQSLVARIQDALKDAFKPWIAYKLAYKVDVKAYRLGGKVPGVGAEVAITTATGEPTTLRFSNLLTGGL